MLYSRPLLLCLSVLHLLFCPSACLSYDPADYLEVYPDPRDPAVLRGRTPLHFALIQSLGGPQFDGSGSVAGVKVALDRINNDSSILPGYTLHYTFADSKCCRTESLRAFFSEILREPRKLAVIGSGCSVATEPTAEISHFYNITQISCVSSSTELRNRTRFPSYFQLLSSEETLAFAFYSVIKEYRWRRVALLVQNENLFTVTANRLTTLLDRDGVEHTTRLFETNMLANLGENPFDENSRIFLFFMYSVSARPLLCEAYRREIHLPRYLLLTPGWYSRQWWRVDNENLSCTVEERESVLFSSLAFLHFKFLNETADANLTTTTGITGGEFLAEEREFLDELPLNLTFSEYSQYCYDATWTLAYALNKTIDSTELVQAYNTTPPFDIQDFTYDRRELMDVILGHLESTEFDGVTGPVSFGNHTRNLNELIIFQFRNVINASDGTLFLDWVKIGNVTPSGNDTYTFNYGPLESIDTVWNGRDNVPYDGVPLKVVATYHTSVTAIFILLAIAGMVWSVVCIIFNFKYRKSKLIKLASSQLNYLIAIGAIILYLDSVLFVIPSAGPNVATAICNITPWLTAIGYSLCYGTILMKMARVYYIFNNPTANKKGIRDWMLIVGVALLVAIDLTILIIYVVVEDARDNLKARQVPFRENEEDSEGEQGVITKYCVYICDSTARSIFLGVLYGYKMVLQVIALVLAFSIRKVKVKGLDDAKFIGAAIYVTSIVLAVTIVGTYSLKDIINAFAGLVCSGFLIGTTVILILVFVPLMVGLHKDPKGENIFSKSSVGTPSGTNLNAASNSKKSVEMDTLRRRIRELEDQVENKKIHTPSSNGTSAAAVNPRARSDTVASALEESKMVNEELKKETTFSGTIWDTPEECQAEQGNWDTHENSTSV